jgi:hypothetical protein
VRNIVFVCALTCVVTLNITAAPASATTTDQAVSDTVAFCEWALGFKFDPATVQAVREGYATDSASDPSGTAATIKDMHDTIAWVQSNPARSPLLRSLIEPQLIAAWQTDTSASAATGKTLVAAWQKHHQIIASGTPPLRASVVNSYIAMFEFLSKQAGKPVPPSVADHAQFTRHVAALYSAATPDQQMQFNNVQTLWLALQDAWASATPAEQNAMRAQWRGTAPVAHVPMPTAPPRSGFTGQTWSVQHWEEHNFVSSEGQSMLNSWSNPF